MKTNFSIKEFIKEVKASNFVKNSSIPLEYVPGTPLFRICNSKLCLVIPFLRYKITGVVDKTYVYPIRYTVTVQLPEQKIVAFEDLSLNPMFCKVDFERPIGLFRHESIKTYTQKQFKDERNKLYATYDKIITDLLKNGKYAKADHEEFAKLLNILLEPSLKPIYKGLDKKFYEKFLND